MKLLLQISAPAHRKYSSGFTQAEAEMIVSAPDRTTECGKRDYAIMILAQNTGLRSIDILGLKFPDVDWNRKELRIVQHKTDIQGLINQKHSVGYPYLESERVLKNFDQFCLMNFPEEKSLTFEIGQHWAVVSPTESAVTFQNRMAPVRELARYVQRLGFEAYVIPMEVGPKCTRGKKKSPHIFTDRELELFFAAVDSLEINKRCILRHLALPVIFRMMYCCGLRPPEARLLETADIDLNNGKIQIRESKGHKDRLVIMPPDLLEICRNYARLLQKTCPGSKYFFPSQLEHLNPYTGIGLAKLFRTCWNSAGIGTYGGDSPRPYSFRHTFATRRLYQWMKEGKDIEAMIPYLSAYMGHERFSDTAYYIHLVPEIFPHMSQMDFSSYEKLLPEVGL